MMTRGSPPHLLKIVISHFTGKNLESWQNALKDYETCKSHVLDYKNYASSLADTDRQIRTHSCFSYCKNGDDANFMGDDRPDCISLEPSMRD